MRLRSARSSGWCGSGEVSDRSTLLGGAVKTRGRAGGATLRALDVKVRRAAEIATSVGWMSPMAVSVALVVAATRTNRRRIAAHAHTFRAALPDTGHQLRALFAGH